MRFANFHTTALCSPTRSCLLTGRNHHSNGMARVADLAVGFPGYWGRIPRRNGFLSETLAANGYAPVAVGKWHLTPEDETHAAAPRDSWPVGRGFQRWYGFHGGETHQFVPNLFQDNHAVLPPRTPEQGYHLTEDLAERAIQYLGEIRSVEPDQPFFLYFATGACHSPHHAPAEWIERYRGRFDGGWDVWRESDVRRASRRWACFPRAPSSRPARLGYRRGRTSSPRTRRSRRGSWSASPASSPTPTRRSVSCSRTSTTSASATTRSWSWCRTTARAPKAASGARSTTRGSGTATRPAGASCANGSTSWAPPPRTTTTPGAGRWRATRRSGAGSARSTRVASPTRASSTGRVGSRAGARSGISSRTRSTCSRPCSSSSGSTRPTSSATSPRARSRATSFAATLRSADAPEHRTTQYFEMLGSRGLYHDGWKAVTFKPLGGMYNDGIDPDAPFEDDVWELYHVAEDFSECHDLAAEEPERLAELVDIWWEEARKYQVLPLDNRPVAALLNPRKPYDQRDRYVFWPYGAPDPGERHGERPQPEPHHHRPRRAPRGREPPKGVLLADGDGARRVVVPPARTASCGSCTTSSARSGTPSRPTSWCHRASTSSRSRSTATATSAASAGC